MKFDTSGNLLKKLSSSKTIGYNINMKSENFAWNDSVFYNFYKDNNDKYYLAAFNYNLDTLWNESIKVNDTSFNFVSIENIEIIGLSEREVLLLISGAKHSNYSNLTPYMVYTKVKDFGNYRTKQQFITKEFENKNKHTLLTRDSNLLAYQNGFLKKYNTEGVLLDSLSLPLITRYNTYNIKYYDNNKIVLAGMGDSDIGDPYEFKINMAMIDYSKWKLLWHKVYPIDQSLLEYTPIYINITSDSNIVFTSNLEYGRSPNYNSRISGFHLITNSLGDSITLFKVYDSLDNHYIINDIDFIDSTTVVGIGVHSDNPYSHYCYTNALIYKRKFSIPPPVKKESPEMEFHWTLYPNPGSDEVILQVEKNFADKIVDIEIFNYNGKLIANYPSFKLENTNRFKLNRLSSGVYLFSITIGSDKYTKRLTVL